jgi:hypothetical protein
MSEDVEVEDSAGTEFLMMRVPPQSGRMGQGSVRS